MLYFDYASTTPVSPEVAEAMAACLTAETAFANPASTHSMGWQAREVVENARRQVAKAVVCAPRDLVFTSGATESDNLAILGALRKAEKPAHAITSVIEHKAVIDAFKQAEQEGVQVTWLKPTTGGVIDPSAVAAAIKPNTRLVSLMHVNNELGSVNDIAGIKAVLPSNVLLHVDAAQSPGKAPVDLQTWGADLVSLSAHKLYGPKGVGALYIRRGVERKLQPLQFGGGHERGVRSGTLPSHQIAGLGAAFAHLPDPEPLWEMRRRLEHALNQLNAWPNGQSQVPNILNYRFPVDAETLMSALPDACLSSGSACNAADLSPSHVLLGLGMSRQDALKSLRISFGRYTTDAELDTFIHQLTNALTTLGDTHVT